MKATYIYKHELGLIPFVMKSALAVMLAIVLVRSADSSMDKIIVLLCAAYFSFGLVKFISGMKNRPLTLQVDNKGIEYRSSKQTISGLWKDVVSVNEYYVPVHRGAGYFRIDLRLSNGGTIWITNNILISENSKREAVNYVEVKDFIARKVPKEKLKFQVNAT